MITRLVVIIFAVACLLCAGIVRSPEAEDRNAAGHSIGLRQSVNNAADVTGYDAIAGQRSVTPERSPLRDGFIHSGDSRSDVQHSRSRLLNPPELGGAIPEPALIILLGMSILFVLHRVRRASLPASPHVDATPRSTAPTATPIRFLDPAA